VCVCVIYVCAYTYVRACVCIDFAFINDWFVTLHLLIIGSSLLHRFAKVNAHTRMHIHTYIHTYKHIYYTHTHTHTKHYSPHWPTRVGDTAPPVAVPKDRLKINKCTGIYKICNHFFFFKFCPAPRTCHTGGGERGRVGREARRKGGAGRRRLPPPLPPPTHPSPPPSLCLSPSLSPSLTLCLSPLASCQWYAL
jgi:hypothetical protein